MPTNLRVYQMALELHRGCLEFDVEGYLRDQLKRASSSVVLNLAEGSAKPTVRDRAKFYRIALGSLRETQAILDIANNNELVRLADKVAASLYRLCRSCA